MILLLSSLASALVTIEVGDSGKYASIREAYTEDYVEGEVTEFVLLPDYRYTTESPLGDGGYLLGLAFGTDVIVRSSDPGELRVTVPIHAYKGANVKIVDMDLQANVTSYNDPLSSASEGSYNFIPALLATGGAHLTAEGCRVTGQAFNSFQAGAMAFGADLTLIGSEFTGNTPATGNANPNEVMNYVVGMRENGNSGTFTLTLVDTVIENTAGPALAVYSEYNLQNLNITGGRIANVGSESAGSAVLTYGIVDTTVSGLTIESAGNSAVKLSAGQHDWRKLDIVEAKGAQGGAFHLADGGNLALNEVVCTECYAEQGGGLVYARGGTSVKVTDLDMIGGGGRDGGALFAEGVALYVERGRFCGVANDNGPLISTSSEIRVTNSVFRNMPVNAPMFGGQGGDLFLINNTFVDNAGPILGGIFTGLEFVNNAVVAGTSLNVGEAPIDLTFSYNLFFDNVETDFGLGIQAGEGNQINVEPGFASAFLDDPRNCEIDPVPATGSALIDAGDPSIADKDGTISDIGAFGGPNADDSELEWSPTDPSELTLMGGCSGGGGLAGFLLALPLLGLNRKRKQWAKQERG
jgi:hypothetical protein